MSEITNPPTIPYYQLDAQHCFVFAEEAHQYWDDPGRYNVPWDAVTVAPPAAGAGQVARWLASTESWEIVADHRGDQLYVESSGQPYQMGGEVIVGENPVSYNGLGLIPSWLTDVAPAPVGEPE